jgi:hypothetical protein
MRTSILSLAAGAAITLAGAASALADQQGTSRDIGAAVDGYLGGMADAALVGGPGSAGSDSGFWIRGGDFSLKINLTLQARYEAIDWDEVEPGDLGQDPEDLGGGDLSGFSLPRATVKFSGTAPCNTCYYLELEFGHFGREFVGDIFGEEQFDSLGPVFQSFNYDNSREAWIEWCACPTFNVRMGQIKTPTTRQMMTPPELQQFVDVSLPSAFVGYQGVGYTDRNRDHGVLVHGAFGCDGAITYMAALTNGDSGDSIRNVLDDRTDDNLAVSARVNWAFLKPIYYEEGALRQTTCEWYGEVGAWGFMHADRVDKPHTEVADFSIFGVDVALGYGGFSFTGAINFGTFDAPTSFGEADTTALLVQLGYIFPGTAWEVAARYGMIEVDNPGSSSTEISEIAAAVNYYLNGHANKLTLDAAIVSNDEGEGGLFDVYAGYLPVFGTDDQLLLLRFQWQLAL